MCDVSSLASAAGIGSQVFGAATAYQGRQTQVAAAELKGQAADFAAGRQMRSAAMSADAETVRAEQAGINADLLARQVDLSRLATDTIYAKGVFDENNFRDKLARVEAKQKAGLGARNIDVSTGSPLLLAGFTAAQGEVDARLIRANAHKDAADSMITTASIAANEAGMRSAKLTALMRANQYLTAGIDAGEAGVFSIRAAALEGEAAQISAMSELVTGATGIWKGLQSAKGSFSSGSFGSGWYGTSGGTGGGLGGVY
ncbi:hypothetical protein IP86_02970 [Rhodopseudomonas sp. AAP120]|uniref:hypothetical protein n=1 Tax=Rhodopseudomonas sp. AAP120 TaxID=1523430 RepID=UPI0006CE1685|nr:hypothetical protein [Rhodopseudomonas sp. AAP120]KPG01786.1 hypothetical protein IP86_02970 [Rhodopseudomonas sp. AAP120]